MGTTTTTTKTWECTLMTETDPCFKSKGPGTKPNAQICEDLGAIGCGDANCTLMGDAGSDAAHCMSPAATTTTTKKTEPCKPMTETAPCFKAKGPGTKPKPMAQICKNLGAIGCGGSNCKFKHPWFKAPYCMSSSSMSIILHV